MQLYLISVIILGASIVNGQEISMFWSRLNPVLIDKKISYLSVKE